MNTDYTDEQLQAAIDEAFEVQSNFTSTLVTGQMYGSPKWTQDRPNRLAIARAFLAALPEPPEAKPAAEPTEAKPPERVYMNRTSDWSAAYEQELMQAGKAEPAQAPAAPTEAAEAKADLAHLEAVHLKDVQELEKRVLQLSGEISACWMEFNRNFPTTEFDGSLPNAVRWLIRENMLAKIPKAAQPTESPQDWTPAEGDTVRLKSGGPVMTVTGISITDAFVCEWFIETNVLCKRGFPAACLTPAKEARP